jgi:hypothetical protein
MRTGAMTTLKAEIRSFPSLPNLFTKESSMAIQVEDLVQAVAEGVLRATEARGGPAAPAPPGTAGVVRADLISRLSFEVLIRAGGIPPAPFASPLLAAAPVVATQAVAPSATK